MRRISLKDRLRYRFDNIMSRGMLALLGILGLATLTLVFLGTMAMLISGFRRVDEEDRSTLENLWLAAMRTLDSGNVGGDTGWGFRVIALIVTLGGIFIFGALIAVLATGINGATGRSCARGARLWPSRVTPSSWAGRSASSPSSRSSSSPTPTTSTPSSPSWPSATR